MSKKSRQQKRAVKRKAQKNTTAQPQPTHSAPKRSRTPWLIAAGLSALVAAGGVYHAFQSHFHTISIENKRLHHNHDEHVADVITSQTLQSPQKYNSITSLEELVPSEAFQIFDKESANINKSTDQQWLIKKHTKHLDQDKIGQVLHTEVRLVSPLPNNEAFQLLEERLNKQLKQYAKLIAPFKPSQHKVVLAHEKMNLRSSNAIDNNGAILMYLVNSTIDFDIFTGMYGKDVLRVQKKSHAFGSVNISVRHVNDRVQVQQKKIYLSPNFDIDKEFRESALLNTTLSEYTHSIFFNEKADTFWKLTAEKDTVKKRKNILLTEEASVHAAVLHYLNRFDKHKPFVKHIRQTYQNSETHCHVDPFFNAIVQFRHKGRKFNNTTGIHALLGFYKEQRFEYFTKDGITRYLNDFAEKRVE